MKIFCERHKIVRKVSYLIPYRCRAEVLTSTVNFVEFTTLTNVFAEIMTYIKTFVEIILYYLIKCRTTKK